MTQEEITLLLTDICGRLKSNPICKVIHKDSEGWKEEDMILSGIIGNEGYFTTENGSVYSCEFKPYLRPLSSMTEEEKMEIYNWLVENDVDFFDFSKLRLDEILISFDSSWLLVNWLIIHHFDYRGLIEQGLAIKVTEENNPYL